MVTATNGIFMFRGQSGRLYSINGYISDVVGANLTFNVAGAAVAGSDTTWRAPEAVVLEDIAITTGPTVAVGLLMKRDNAPVNASTINFKTVLDTLATRPRQAIPFPAGTLVGAVQY